MIFPTPENGIWMTFHQSLDDASTIMINNFIVQGQRGIGIGRKVYEEWQRNIPQQYNKLLLRAKNDRAFSFWEKMGFASERGPNSDGEHWMIKDISGVVRDARIPFMYTTSVPAEEAAYKTNSMGLSEDAQSKAKDWLSEVSDQSVSTGRRRWNFADAPCDDTLAAAIRIYPGCLQYLKENPSDHFLYLAVHTDGWSLCNINKRSPSLELEAVKSRPAAIEYVRGKTATIQFLSLTKDLPIGRFDVERLAEYDSYYSDAVLEMVRPGLATIRGLYQDCDAGERMDAYRALFDCQIINAPDIDLPTTLTP